MVDSINKEIELVKARLEKLQREHETEQERERLLGEAFRRFQHDLQVADIDFDCFVETYLSDIKKSIRRIEGNRAVQRSNQNRARVKATLKIPAGSYTCIPTASDPDKVFVVSPRGPRPKEVREYAEKVGLEQFLAECKL